MGMSLGIKKITFAPSEDQSWLASAAGTQTMDSITLDQALCVAKFPTGVIPSGIPLTRQGSGRYAPSITAEVPAYHLFTTCDLSGGVLGNAPVDMPASGFWNGEIIAAKVPTYAAITTVVAANTVAGLIKYV